MHRPGSKRADAAGGPPTVKEAIRALAGRRLVLADGHAWRRFGPEFGVSTDPAYATKKAAAYAANPAEVSIRCSMAAGRRQMPADMIPAARVRFLLGIWSRTISGMFTGSKNDPRASMGNLRQSAS